MISQPVFRSGDSPVFDSDYRENHVQGAVGRRDTIEANIGESLASLTERAYGVNTPYYRERIMSANGNLKGTVYVPR